MCYRPRREFPAVQQSAKLGGAGFFFFPFESYLCCRDRNPKVSGFIVSRKAKRKGGKSAPPRRIERKKRLAVGPPCIDGDRPRAPGRPRFNFRVVDTVRLRPVRAGTSRAGLTRQLSRALVFCLTAGAVTDTAASAIDHDAFAFQQDRVASRAAGDWVRCDPALSGTATGQSRHRGGSGMNGRGRGF